MKKYLTITAALVLALTGCSSSSKTEETQTTEPEVVEETTQEEEEVVDEGPTIEWVDVSSAEDAAKGAGFDKFGVIKEFTIGDLDFKDPSFAYAGGVAQATYDQPACAIFLRKGVGSYSTPLSDRNLDEFTAKWFKVDNGVTINCYGVARGAATVATWTDGDQSYALTFQGLGGEEMSMTEDELVTVVRGIQEANADKNAEDQKKSDDQSKSSDQKKDEQKQDDSSKKSTLISSTDAEALAEKDCNGDCTSIDLVNTTQYGQCWYAVCVDNNGTTYTYYVDNNGVHLLSKKEAEKKDDKKSTDEHYEGENVTIYGSVYAEWHKQNDGKWYATFTTYNGTPIYATPAPAGGGWVFYAQSNGKTVQVIYSDQESSVTGEYGPAGISSHWVNLNDAHDWY